MDIADLTDRAGFWGPTTSTIDWCEPNYQKSHYVAELANTVSNLSFVMLGLLGAYHESGQRSKRSFIWMYLTISCIGLGSMAFHGTLTFLGQALDELPMVWFLLGCIYVQNHDLFATPKLRRTVQATLWIYAMGYSIIHLWMGLTTAFQVHFGTLVAFMLLGCCRKMCKFELTDEVKHVIKLPSIAGISAFAFWLIDYHGCEYFRWAHANNIWYINPHGHVIWHILMGYAAFCMVVAFRLMDCMSSGKQFRIEYRYGLLPMVFRQIKTTKNLLTDTEVEIPRRRTSTAEELELASRITYT
jgi:dihydroceramidase